MPEVLTPGILGATARSNPIRFSKDGLASMLQSTTPGFGPMVTVPIREFALKDPSLEETFGFMFPFGHPEGGTVNRMIEGFLPAYQRNLINLATETPTKERQVQYFSQQIYVERELSGDPIDLTNTEEVNAWINEANQRAKISLHLEYLLEWLSLHQQLYLHRTSLILRKLEGCKYVTEQQKVTLFS